MKKIKIRMRKVIVMKNQMKNYKNLLIQQLLKLMKMKTHFRAEVGLGEDPARSTLTYHR